MSDSFTVTTNTSWFSRLGSSIKGVAAGLALVLIGIGLLFWNEGRTVENIRTNAEGSAAVVSVAVDRIDPSKDGQLIHIAAPAHAEGKRTDPTFGITADALLLARKVEYYQWHETRKSDNRTKLGGGEEVVTTYSYARAWSDFAQDSANFHDAAAHANPAPDLKAQEFRAEKGNIGAFTLDETVLSSIGTSQPLALSQEQIAEAAKTYGRKVSGFENGLYVGENPAEPAIGDMRVTYHIAPQGAPLSIVGAQTAGTLQAYPTKAGSPILMVRSGTASADQMFAQAKAGNSKMAWILRGVGLLVLITAFKMIFGPLGVIGDVVPLVGSIVRMGTGFVATVIGLGISVITIAIAWLFYRPLLSVLLFALVGGIVFGLLWWRKRHALAVADPAPAPAPVAA